MATVTGLDAATRARLIRDYGAPEDLLDFLESEGYEPEQIVAAFKQMTVEAIARRVGYELADAAAAPQPARAATPARAAAPARTPARRRSRSGRSGYRAFTYGVALAFGLFIALMMWRIDGYFGVNFLKRIPGLTELPNTVFHPFVWTWLIGLGVSALQGAFWPHRAVYAEDGALLEEGSTPQEIITWLVVLLGNVASSALGMMPIIMGMDLMGVVVPETGWGLWATAWVLAAVFALYPEWAARVFGGKLWELLVPDSIRQRIKAVKNGLIVVWRTIMSLLPADPRGKMVGGKMVVGGVLVALALVIVVWLLMASQGTPKAMPVQGQAIWALLA
ncbi:hypothetical protein [Chloroflexus sp.]|uniref:hypothetical protein n=1 Tax=Chloroflexus sp. TaxID=1904827 RepID=UPI002ACD7BE9|nr:hypothetical protein [Chloroflexus sp.]